MGSIVQLFSGLPSWLSTFFVAMSPIGELRLALPLALSVYKLPWYVALFWSVLGNMVPVALILWLLEPISQFLSQRIKFFEKFFGWLFTRTRKKHSQRFERWGAVALVSFVALPLPMTGGWTAALCAFVFGIPFRKALFLIFLGVIIAGIIVTLTSLGVLFSFYNLI